MMLDRPSQIRAMLGSGKILHIGGRPVVVPHSNPASSRARSYTIQLALAFVAIYVIWGSTYLAIRYAVETIPPLVTAGIRHSIAGALFFLIGHGTLHWAEQYVGSGLAALLIATEPMFILVLGWMMGQQKISRVSALGLGLGVVGVVMLTGAELTVKGSSPWGLLAVLLGSLAWSFGVVISPRLQLPTDALGRTALPTLCGAALLLIAAGVTGQFQQTHWSTITVRSIFGLGYLITFGSVIAFTAYTWLLQRVPPALVATHTYANPVVAVILGWLLAHEPLSMRVVMASVAILGAIVLIRRGERAGVVKPPEAVARVADVHASEECA
jgi:drug/metabolite transporter (DMT)-like permease